MQHQKQQQQDGSQSLRRGDSFQSLKKIDNENLPKCENCQEMEIDLLDAVEQTNKLKRQNDKSRSELREINKKLDETLEKLKVKKQEKPQNEPREEILQKELKNAEKQLELYKKTLASFESKHDVEYNSEKVAKLTDLYKERQSTLENEKSKNKLLIKEKRDLETKIISQKQDNDMNKVRDEILQLKAQMRMIKQTNHQEEKNFKKQQEYLVKLKQKHQEVCAQLNIQYTVVEPKTEDDLYIREKSDSQQLQIEQSKKQPVKSKKKLKEEEEQKKKDKEEGKEVVELTIEKFRNILQQIEIIKKNKKSIEKLYNLKIDELKKQLSQMEQDISEKEVDVSEKKKEIQLANERIKELTQILKQSQQEIQIENSKPKKPGMKEEEMLAFLNKGKETRREQYGLTIGSQNARSFENSAELPEQKDYYIAELKFWFAEDLILGMEITYRERNGKEQIVSCFKPEKEDGLKVKSLSLSGTEYVNHISGFYSNLNIEFLQIMTSRGNTIKVGSEKNSTRGRKFTFNITNQERVLSFFGTVDQYLPVNKKKQTNQPESVNTSYLQEQDPRQQYENQFILIFIGAELRKKNVYRSPVRSAQREQTSQDQINSQEDEEGELIVGEGNDQGEMNKRTRNASSDRDRSQKPKKKKDYLTELRKKREKKLQKLNNRLQEDPNLQNPVEKNEEPKNQQQKVRQEEEQEEEQQEEEF